MKTLILLASLASALASSPVFASACDSPVDLRRAGSLDGLENVAQGYDKTNLCGFFTFSQYLDAWRISNRSERGKTMPRSSSVAIGVDHAIRRNIPYWVPFQNSTDPLALRFGRWGSTFCALAKAVKEEGYCVDPALPSRTVDATAKFADATTFVYGKLQSIAETPAPLRERVLTREIASIYDRYSKWAAERRTQASSQDAVLAWIREEPTKPYRTIRKIFFPNCAQPSARRDDFDFNSCSSEWYVDFDRNGVLLEGDPVLKNRASNRIHSLLSGPNALPVPFAYCSKVLLQGKQYEGAGLGFNCGLHWSLIAGRKKIGEDCYLLVRNSWTPGRRVYSPDWIVEGGDIWVREKELLRSMFLIQWLEN